MTNTTTRGKAARWGGIAGLMAAGTIGGAVLTGTLTANAATTTGTAAVSSSVSSTATSGANGTARATYPAHGTAAHERLEKLVTGTDAAKARAAAVKSVGSGTAGAVTTDVSGSGYEVTVTKADGSSVEVHLTSSFGVDDHGR
jgi:hypothetical protein